MYKVVIVEDEIEIREELKLLLENDGYAVFAVSDFENAVKDIEAFVADLILLDIGLPNKDGFSLCMEIRKIMSVPIIFVTSHDNSMDELKALNIGVDDYVTKPYNIPVLMARIKRAIRRTTGSKEAISHNGLSLNISKGLISNGEIEEELTKNEIKIMHFLMKQAGKIVSRADLIEYLWEEQIYIDDNTLSVNITRLRTKLNELGAPDYITTKRGMGYKV